MRLLKNFLDVIRRFQFSFPMEKFHVLWGIIKIVARNLDPQRYKSLRIHFSTCSNNQNEYSSQWPSFKDRLLCGMHSE